MFTCRRGIAVFFATLTFTPPQSAGADDWPQWGGNDPGRNMVSAEKNLPESFEPGEKRPDGTGIDMATTKNVRWVARLGAYIYGNPTVAGGRVFAGTDDTLLGEDKRFVRSRGGMVHCLDAATGATLWRLAVPKRPDERLPKDAHFSQQHYGTCSSPAVAGGRVFVMTSACEIACLDVDGLADGNDGPFTDEGAYMAGPGKKPIELAPTDADIIWLFDIVSELDVCPHDAASCSPLVDGRFLYCVTSNGVEEKHERCIRPEAPSYFCLDTETGRLLATDAERMGARLWHCLWSPPSIGVVGGRKLVFFGGGDGFCYAFEALAEIPEKPISFKKVWWYDCNPPHYRLRDGKPIPYYAGDKRKKDSPNKDDGTYLGPSQIIATPVFHQGRVYVTIGQDPAHGRGRGLLHCIDAAKTGDITESGRVWSFEGLERSMSSVAIENGLLYAVDLAGRLHCFDAPTGGLKWVHELKAETWGTPLVADGKLFIGTKKYFHVLAAGERPPKELAKISLGSPSYGTPVAANGTLYVASERFLWAVAKPPDTAASSPCFCIEVVDAATKRGVPLVELETVDAIRYHTDSNGIAAFHEPGLMNQSVFFFVKSHGYEFPKDGFGMQGKALTIVPGGHARLEIKRINIAERLYRVTGGGIYRDSLLVGRSVPIKEPLLNGLVLGQDSVLTALYAGKIYWFWGDTSRPAYPLGNFNTSGATSLPPDAGGLDPERGVDLTYFVDERGFSRGMAPMPGPGPTWIGGLAVLRDEQGRERMYTAYSKVRQSMETYERGLAVFDDEKAQFVSIATVPLDVPIFPGGHSVTVKDGGVDYLYFAVPYPLIRVRATGADYGRPSAYEAYTCLKEGSRLSDPQIDRGPDGSVRYGWKANTPAVGPQEQEKLIKSGALKPGEALLNLREPDTGKKVFAHAGSVYWNAYRQRWVMIAVEQFGSSFLGEVWFAEADTPVGPWVYGRKVVTHEKYSYYNPKQHPLFAKDNGRIIFFEGTYANTFSGNTDRTPRYDYNQVMYKLDLADERLILPVPIYRAAGPDGAVRFGTAPQLGAQIEKAKLAFFALDRRKEGVVPVRISAGAVASAAAGTEPTFYAIPAEADPRPATAAPLFEYTSEDGSRRDYGAGEESPDPGLRRADAPLCLVWHVKMPPRN